MLGRVWNAIRNALTGVKTLVVAAIIFTLGLADYFNLMDLRPILERYFGEDRAALVMILLPVIFSALRFITSTPVLQNVRRTLKGGIDDPEGEM